MSAALSATRKPPVRKQDLGKARDLCRRLVATEAAALATVEELLKPLRARLQRHPSPRHDMLVQLVRRWKAEVPATNRLAIWSDLHGNKLHLLDCRVSPGSYRLDEWNDGYNEHGLIVQNHEVLVGPGACRIATTPLLLIGLHALARWYERSADPTEATLFSEFLLLLRHRHARLTATNSPEWEFLCRTSNGEWRGESSTADNLDGKLDNGCVRVQTFVP